MDDQTLPFTPPDPATLAAIHAAVPQRGDAKDSEPPPEADSGGALASHVGRPIAEVMDQTLWTVHAEDSIEQVEAAMAAQALTSIPVVGSNGAIIGMIGAPELAQFLIDGKNPRAVQAWEICRIRSFEVNTADTVEDVAKLMTEAKVETISVTECGRLKGVVSTQDLLQDLLRALPDDTTQ